MKYIEIAQQILDSNYVAGVRSLSLDEQYKIGDYCRDSYEWDVENDCSTYHTTGETANGTCATHIKNDSWDAEELAAEIEKAIAFNSIHGGKQVIIAGKRTNNDGMFDPNEVRIINAVVIAVV